MPVSSFARPTVLTEPISGASPEDVWRALFDSEPPRSASLIDQAIAWREQVLVAGDVAPAIARDLAVAAGEVRAARLAAPTDVADIAMIAPSTGAALPTASSQLQIGTRLVKSHGGKTHVVEVTADGMLYEGLLYSSLSAVAKVITGTHWNGLLFFGLRKRRVYPGKEAASG